MSGSVSRRSSRRRCRPWPGSPAFSTRRRPARAPPTDPGGTPMTMARSHPLIVGLGGTTRPGSSTEQALRCALDAARAQGAETALIAGPELVLPMFAPESPVRTHEAQRLVELLRRCDGIILASPGYHGSISGLLKNA